MLEEYQEVTSPTMKNRPFAKPVKPPGDGGAAPFAVIAARLGGSRGRRRGWEGRVWIGVRLGGVAGFLPPAGGVCVSLCLWEEGGRRRVLSVWMGGAGERWQQPGRRAEAAGGWGGGGGDGRPGRRAEAGGGGGTLGRRAEAAEAAGGRGGGRRRREAGEAGGGGGGGGRPGRRRRRRA
ncbi:hypothetical protein GUJ93_ZPchr0008g12224 [Zizania palustris]|uniref:Uncharacterized protein n=1 Tax=Zizania palustris TaxID=103762 RepID=A0A8J5R0P5_ZIZPA|nr:hypothetical protein GUJ93_ZPchr0008g12224 [Zizania palustris]